MTMRQFFIAAASLVSLGAFMSTASAEIKVTVSSKGDFKNFCESKGGNFTDGHGSGYTCTIAPSGGNPGQNWNCAESGQCVIYKGVTRSQPTNNGGATAGNTTNPNGTKGTPSASAGGAANSTIGGAAGTNTSGASTTSKPTPASSTTTAGSLNGTTTAQPKPAGGPGGLPTKTKVLN